MTSHILGQRSLSPDDLKDTYIGRVACMRYCMHMQFMVKLHANAIMLAIFEGMQFCLYRCLSTRLDLKNAVLGDETPKLDYLIYKFLYFF